MKLGQDFLVKIENQLRFKPEAGFDILPPGPAYREREDASTRGADTEVVHKSRFWRSGV